MNNFFDGPIRKQIEEFYRSLPCRIQKPYPSAEIPAENKRVANLLLAAFANGGNAEFSAVAQYMNHSQTIDLQPVSNLELCIALVEMYHLQLIGKMIHSLGGELRYWAPNHFYWTGGYVAYGDTLCDKLSLDIFAEQEALAGYEALLRMIRLETQPAMRQVEAVIQRIMEDEMLHVNLFTQAFEEHCGMRWPNNPYHG